MQEDLVNRHVRVARDVRGLETRALHWYPDRATGVEEELWTNLSLTPGWAVFNDPGARTRIIEDTVYLTGVVWHQTLPHDGTVGTVVQGHRPQFRQGLIASEGGNYPSPVPMAIDPATGIISFADPGFVFDTRTYGAGKGVLIFPMTSWPAVYAS